ncbi:FHA domain-containing protein [Haliangium ochraceum]|uniref:FHA domain-containing protein n=1 Tax=Haliangium ochraceum TaxID=80816 RepID=UPI001E62F959|nr:FHA domain-containing protein [Haliangium ochraceum]
MLFEKIRYKQFPKRTITVGRAPKSDIRIRDKSVSRTHCYITRQTHGSRDTYWLADTGSVNGVLVDDPASDASHWQWRTAVQLRAGMRLMLGDVRLLVTDLHGNFPMLITRHSDFRRKALTYYGNPSAASTHTGIALRELRRVQETVG